MDSRYERKLSLSAFPLLLAEYMSVEVKDCTKLNVRVYRLGHVMY